MVKSNLGNTLPVHEEGAYPVAISSAFERLPCTWSEGPSANQTHVFSDQALPRTGNDTNFGRGSAQEELLSFVDNNLFGKMGLIYVLRASSLRHAYQQAAAIADDAIAAGGALHKTARESLHSSLLATPEEVDMFLFLPLGRDRRAFARQARATALGRPIQVKLLTDPRAETGLSRAEVRHRGKGSAGVRLIVDIIELPTASPAFSHLIDITRQDATESAEEARMKADVEAWRWREGGGIVQRVVDAWQEGGAWWQRVVELIQTGRMRRRAAETHRRLCSRYTK